MRMKSKFNIIESNVEEVEKASRLEHKGYSLMISEDYWKKLCHDWTHQTTTNKEEYKLQTLRQN